MRIAGIAAEYAAAASILAVVSILLVYHSDALPMQLWDESRIANNALEAARDGHWLVPTFNGLRDHWNTKPPLLIWAIAALLKLGFAPLWALRLPGMVAAFATVAIVWSVPKFALRDRAAALVAGALLVGSSLYLGWHVTRTGDYDGPESVFILGYVLCVWRAFDAAKPTPWLAAAAALVVLAVMSKGVAGVLPLPGLAFLAAARREATARLLKDWRTWACALAAAGLCAGYYLSREAYDPGYVGAVAFQELGGRFNGVKEGHVGGPFFYLPIIAMGAASTLLLTPLSAVTIVSADRQRRDLALATLGAAASLLAVLSISKTKIFWYAGPAIPLLSLAAAIGCVDAVRVLSRRAVGLGVAAAAGIAVVLAIGIAMSLSVGLSLSQRYPDRLDRRIHYGPFMSELWNARLTPVTKVMDSTFWNGGTVNNYEPIDDFYMRLYGRRWSISRLRPGEAPRPASVVLTCDAQATQWLEDRFLLSPLARSRSCILARVSQPRAPQLGS